MRKLVPDEHKDDQWWLFAVIVAYTGMRAADVIAFRWDWVDWNAGYIIELASILKTKATRYIPLQTELRAILELMAKVGLIPVFGIATGQNTRHKRREKSSRRIWSALAFSMRVELSMTCDIRLLVCWQLWA